MSLESQMHHRVRAQKAPWSNGVQLCIMVEHGREYGYVPPLYGMHPPWGTDEHPGPFEKLEEGQQIAGPTTELGTKAAQELMDDLWQCGIRPSEGTGSAGQLAATQRHLEDMQGIAKGVLRKMGVKP